MSNRVSEQSAHASVAADGGASKKLPDPITTLVVDDHPAVQWGLVQLLEDQPDIEVAAVAASAETGLGQAEREGVDVAVVDYHLGGRNGLWLARKLKMYDLEAPKGVKNMQKIVAGRQLWNYDNLEPAEKKLIL